ncbi:hypothetical protein ACFE04_012093 [Oxalis oulophora]
MFIRHIFTLNSTKAIHAHLIRTHLFQHPNHSITISNIIKSYALSFPSGIRKAQLVFNQIERPTLLVYNHMIRGYSQSEQPHYAIEFFIRMYRQRILADNFTFIFCFKACARVSDIVNGQNIHVHVIKLGFRSHLFVVNALIHMYASCRRLDYALKVFDEMIDRDLVSWNSLICGYSQVGKHKEVLGLFNSMRDANVDADKVTLSKVIFACAVLGDHDIADSMVCYIEDNRVEINVYLGNTLIDMYGRRGLVDLARGVFNKMCEKNVVSWNAMIMGYAKAGDLDEAQKLFNEMPKRDVISWTTMITGYSRSNKFSDAVNIFQQMMNDQEKPDHVTVATVLSACAHLGMLEMGEAIHDYILMHGVKLDLYVGNSLIDMYLKCGSVQKALVVFHGMKEKDSVSWTCVITGLAVNGFAESALELFSIMLKENIQPSHGTFIGVLLACTHTGLVDKGLEYFETMENYGLTPEMKHYGCVVDLLSRSGDLERAHAFINRMPIIPDILVWRIMLSACKTHKNLVFAEIAIKKLLELDPSNSGNYALLSSTYAASDRWDDAAKIRELMMECDVQKPSGWSSIEDNVK